jgi:hypothetical protein
MNVPNEHIQWTYSTNRNGVALDGESAGDTAGNRRGYLSRLLPRYRIGAVEHERGYRRRVENTFDEHIY